MSRLNEHVKGPRVTLDLYAILRDDTGSCPNFKIQNPVIHPLPDNLQRCVDCGFKFLEVYQEAKLSPAAQTLLMSPSLPTTPDYSPCGTPLPQTPDNSEPPDGNTIVQSIPSTLVMSQDARQLQAGQPRDVALSEHTSESNLLYPPVSPVFQAAGLSVPKHVQVIRQRKHSKTEEEQTAFTVGEQDSRTIAMNTPTYVTFLHNLYMSVLFRLPDRYSRDAPQPPMLNGHDDGTTQAVYKRWVNEWTQMVSIASVLFGVLFTILQISSAAYDLIVRTVVWLAIVCLFFGATYAVVILLRTFGKLEMNTEGLDWIRQVTRPPRNRFWNPRIMLSMPAVWISWGAIYFAVLIVTFLWRSGATDEKDEDLKPSTQEYGPRFTATFIFVLGAVYLGLIIRDVNMMG
ncbi:hypothetical protein FB451DRAFT_1527186, partial [Mycena latifolia]